ncbi:cytochrome c family protein [Palleronia sp. LCG004]|uniref:c-type cytochrome n=1 Tax=Palleronia sp. LCG004 TaxID=3079304 RepID=UPI002943CEB5|nr:cytochrome c family protein [Palleronia sp. LCG004]WOI56426.1 cytochrome c family protein [Palleronia sp. LCG004]
MFDTMTLTKIVGGFCGALLIFLLGAWGAELIYHGSGHDEGEQAYSIEVPEGEGAEPEEEAAPFEEVFASADAGAGERVFGRCRACHAVDGSDGVGPHLNGVVGREVDAVAGYAYSGALEEVADVWSPENLNGFLENPRGYAPGTKMSFNGLPSVEERANVIAYLQTTE